MFLQGVYETNKITKFGLIEKQSNMNGNHALTGSIVPKQELNGRTQLFALKLTG
jgi:hypothetical protein